MARRKAHKGTIEKSFDSVKSLVKNINDEAFTISDKVLDVSISNGAKWQKIMSKAINGGIGLFEKQQNIVFDTLEEIKGQIRTGNRRAKKLIGYEKPVSKKSVKPSLKKTTKKVIKEVSAKQKSTSKTTKDDLTLIGGIGPKFATLLNQAGINTFKQLAAADINDLKNLLKNAGPMFKSLNPILWKQEAALILKGKTVKSN